MRNDICDLSFLQRLIRNAKGPVTPPELCWSVPGAVKKNSSTLVTVHHRLTKVGLATADVPRGALLPLRKF